MTDPSTPTGYATLNDAEVAEAERLALTACEHLERHARQRAAEEELERLKQSFTDKLVNGGRC
jgi:arginine decarboxylase-like protein